MSLQVVFLRILNLIRIDYFVLIHRFIGLYLYLIKVICIKSIIYVT
jgi:hypothetical protein